MDFDFMVRDMDLALRKLRHLARRLEADLIPPRTAASNVYSVVNEKLGIYIDFLDTVTGVTSFASLWSRAVPVAFDAAEILVASLRDVLESKRAAARPKDKVLEIIAATLEEQNRNAGAAEP